MEEPYVKRESDMLPGVCSFRIGRAKRFHFPSFSTLKQLQYSITKKFGAAPCDGTEMWYTTFSAQVWNRIIVYGEESHCKGFLADASLDRRFWLRRRTSLTMVVSEGLLYRYCRYKSGVIKLLQGNTSYGIESHISGHSRWHWTVVILRRSCHAHVLGIAFNNNIAILWQLSFCAISCALWSYWIFDGQNKKERCYEHCIKKDGLQYIVTAANFACCKSSYSSHVDEEMNVECFRSVRHRHTCGGEKCAKICNRLWG